MTPEIRLGGARKFYGDAVALARLFSSSSVHDCDDDDNITGSDGTKRRGNYSARSFDRVLDASALMTLDPSRLRSLREALRGLVAVRDGGIAGALFGGGGSDLTTAEDPEMSHRLSINDFYADERLVDEARSMLAAKGFGSLGLEDAVSIMNRRRT